MQAVVSEHETLLHNLRTAFEGESNAHARYLEFAEKAEGEGWHGVASLFRACATAEAVHLANHGRILHQLGGGTDFTPAAVEVKNTFDNVRTALDGEMFEVDTMYAAFLQQARIARDVAAVRTFTWALNAEKSHVRLFNEALALLEVGELLDVDEESSWITMHREFYVCPVCGYTSENAREAEVCPSCFCAWSRSEVCS